LEYILSSFLIYENPYDLVCIAVQTVNWQTTGHPGWYGVKEFIEAKAMKINMKYDNQIKL
jgi:hypothetical protein